MIFDPFEPIKRDVDRIVKALGMGGSQGESELGRQIKLETQKFEGQKFYLTEKGQLAMSVLGASEDDPPTLVTYTELIKSLVAPLTQEQEASIEEVARSLGIERANLQVMKITREQAVDELNRTIIDLIKDGLLGKIDHVTYSILGVGSKTEYAFRIFLGLSPIGWAAGSPETAVTAGALLLEVSKEPTGKLQSIVPWFAETLTLLVQRNYVGRVGV